MVDGSKAPRLNAGASSVADELRRRLESISQRSDDPTTLRELPAPVGERAPSPSAREVLGDVRTIEHDVRVESHRWKTFHE